VAKDINMNTYHSSHQCSDEGKITRPREECDLFICVTVTQNCSTQLLQSVVICSCNKLTKEDAYEK